MLSKTKAMKKIVLIFLILLSQNIFSQEDAWVYFVDKPNAQFYFDNPLEMLSQRALDRRANQNIDLDIKDVPIHQDYVDEITAAEGIEVKAKSKWFNAVHVRGSISGIQALANLVFVENIQFADRSLNQSNRKSNAKKVKAVNKQMDTQENFVYGNSSNQIEMLNGHLLHQQDYTGTGKIIAVMDSGFPNVNTASSFQRLRDNNQILGGYNFVDRNDDFYTRHQHGTLVFSLIAGFVENELVGTAPNANYYLFITEDVGSENPVEESYWVEAAEEADRLGVDVITSSLGYFGYDNPNYSHTYSQMTGNQAFASRGANIAFTRGIVVIASAGNSGATADPYVGVPGEATNVLAIGAVKADETYATFSSIGPSFDGRVKPDIMAQGQAAVVSNTSGAIVTANGTSFSGPIMAGMITSFWSAVPNLTAAEVVQFVKQSADRYTVPTNQFGYGIPDFQLALTNALNAQTFDNEVFSIYPNPIKNVITITIPDESVNATLYLYNNLGQRVNEILLTTSNQTINVENLASGIYFFELSAKNKLIQGKLVKQ